MVFCIIRIDLTMDKYHYYIDCGMEMKENRNKIGDL